MVLQADEHQVVGRTMTRKVCISMLSVIAFSLVASTVRAADAAPAQVNIRSALFKIRDAHSARRYVVLPLVEVHFLKPDYAVDADLLGDVLTPRRKPRPREVRDSVEYRTIDREVWQGIKWAFEILRPSGDEAPKRVVCSQAALSCELMTNEDKEDGSVDVRYLFARTPAGPKLQRIEIEPTFPSLRCRDRRR